MTKYIEMNQSGDRDDDRLLTTTEVSEILSHTYHGDELRSVLRTLRNGEVVRDRFGFCYRRRILAD